MLVADVNLELLDKKGRHMPQIVWDDVGQKAYESGLDRGVLYFTDGTVLPWNGLISVEENHGRTKENIYYDGVKIGESQTREPFSATVTAYTYPWVLEYITGDYTPRRGITAGEQVSLPVAFSYRTKIGMILVEMSVAAIKFMLYSQACFLQSIGLMRRRLIA